jgi:oleate hydratase
MIRRGTAHPAVRERGRFPRPSVERGLRVVAGMTSRPRRNPGQSHVYLVGSGIASLASAVYLERDAGVPGPNIHILEKGSILGGALDGAGVSVTAESLEFNRRFVSHAQARLLRDGKKLDVSSFGLSQKHQAELLKLTFTSESSLGNRRIEDWFDHDFFTTNFWFIWTSMFAFQKWSSLAEMRRYMKRFIHLVEGLPWLGGVLRTKYNQYHSVVVPLQRYLEARGVKFQLGTEVVDVSFDLSRDEKVARLIHLKGGGEIALGKDDCVLITNGSLTESTDNGTWDRPAQLKGLADSGSWRLWKKLAGKDPAFGNPGPFCDRIDLQRWYSFTATLQDRTFHDHMERFSGNVDGTGGLVTLTDSAWMMSFVIARQPHFPNQPDDVKVFWGYGLHSDRKGTFVQKTMAECTGREMLEELWFHLKVQEIMRPVMEAGKANCIPVAMPYVDSLFQPRTPGDRPAVLPKGSTNFAFLGQFAEAPLDCVFTVEYSVRTAQMAVYGLFETAKEVLPVYDSIHRPEYLIKAAKAIAS